MMLIFVLNGDSGGSDGISTQLPAASNFQPGYTHRNPHSSLRPKTMGAPRCGHLLPTRPTIPEESRNAIRSSPNIRTRTGGPSGSGTSSVNNAGNQYRRKPAPIGDCGPTRVSRSFISLDSIAYLSSSTSPAPHLVALHAELMSAV